jgi:uncharacterized protein YjaZ
MTLWYNLTLIENLDRRVIEMSKQLRSLMVIPFLLMLISCSNEPAEQLENENIEQVANETEKEEEKDQIITTIDPDLENLPKQKIVTFTHNEQTFEIIPLYEESISYIKALKANPSLDSKETYIENVVKPMQKIYAGKMYFPNKEDILSNIQYTSSTYLTQLKENAIFLLENQDKINELIKEALISSSDSLPGKDKRVIVMPQNYPNGTYYIKANDGLQGYGDSKHLITLQIGPSIIENSVKNLVAHEYFHTMEMEYDSNWGEQHMILDRVIGEGKADSFANILYPYKDKQKRKPFSDDELKTVADLLKLHINASPTSQYYLYEDFKIGHRGKGIPRESNYKLGYLITESYLKNNPDVSLEEWTKLSGKEVVLGSDYSYILE